MAQLGSVIRGTGLQKKDFQESGVGCIHYGKIFTHFGTWATETPWRISPDLAQKLRKAAPGDLVIATTSEDDEGVGKAVAWLGEAPVAVSSDTLIYTKHGLNPKYVAYFFQTSDFHAQKMRHLTGTKVRRMSKRSLGKIVIPSPPLKVQAEIAHTLDAFEALTSDLSTGLPAEIAARRKQYEHYRDRLLTFKEAA